jgi:hypothetical protein
LAGLLREQGNLEELRRRIDAGDRNHALLALIAWFRITNSDLAPRRAIVILESSDA